MARDTQTLDHTVFISEHIDRTYEHHIQVIPTIYKSRKGKEIKAYKYAVTSSEHTDTDQFPSAKFTYAHTISTTANTHTLPGPLPRLRAIPSHDIRQDTKPVSLDTSLCPRHNARTQASV